MCMPIASESASLNLVMLSLSRAAEMRGSRRRQQGQIALRIAERCTPLPFVHTSVASSQLCFFKTAASWKQAIGLLEPKPAVAT